MNIREERKLCLHLARIINNSHSSDEGKEAMPRLLPLQRSNRSAHRRANITRDSPALGVKVTDLNYRGVTV